MGAEVKYLFNAGTIRGNEFAHLYHETYIAGIVGEANAGYSIEGCVNIGHIQSGSFDIAGGIAGVL